MSNRKIKTTVQELVDQELGRLAKRMFIHRKNYKDDFSILSCDCIHLIIDNNRLHHTCLKRPGSAVSNENDCTLEKCPPMELS